MLGDIDRQSNVLNTVGSDPQHTDVVGLLEPQVMAVVVLSMRLERTSSKYTTDLQVLWHGDIVIELKCLLG